MKHITQTELANLMGYSNVKSFHSSPIKKQQLINLVELLEKRIDDHYLKMIDCIHKDTNNAFRKQGISI